MKNKKFFDIAHSRLYLIGSIIRVDDQPVLVSNVSHNSSTGQVLHYLPIEKIRSEKTKSVRLSSKRVDMNPIPLGFINFREFGKEKIAIRTYRIPCRQWRIGLTEENLKIAPTRYNNYDDKKKIMKSIYFKQSVCGEFPKIEEIIKMIKDKEADSQAFSRDFAIEKNKLMFIQLKEPVGKLFKGEVMLFDDYLYLNQLLEKAI